MSSMFSGSDLVSIDVSNFDTKNVKDMSYMFYECSSLTNIDVSNFCLNSNPKLEEMFLQCDNLTTLNVGFEIPEKVNDLTIMVRDCKNIHEIIVPRVKNGASDITLSISSYLDSEIYERDTHESAVKEGQYGNYTYKINVNDQPHTYIFSKTHKWDNEQRNATCTEESIVSTCTICGEKIGTKTDHLGHIAGSPVIENRVEPTYDKEGGYDEVVYCTRDDNGCGHSEISRKHVVLEKLKKPDSTDAKKDDGKKDEPSKTETKPSSTASTKTTYADGLNQRNGE